MRREGAARRWLRVRVAALVLVLLAAALGLVGARSLTREDFAHLLVQPGLWTPLGLFALILGGVLLARRAYGGMRVGVRGDQLSLEPGWLRRIVSGLPCRQVDLSAVRRVGALALREGSFLVLTGPHSPSARLPMQHPAACEAAGALLARLSAEAFEGEARAMASALGEGGDAGRPNGASGAPVPPDLEALWAAGLWHQAAALAWPVLISNPRDPEAGRQVYRIERHRLPAVPRLRLAMALAALHPEEALYAFEVARLALAQRWQDLAREALDSLVAGPAPPAPAEVWRRWLREHRALPAPVARATFGIEVGMPDHRLEGDTLVVSDRFRVGLDWFVAYRVAPGFWGPARSCELVDLWGARHLLRGDPDAWALSLQAAAPHLGEVHDEGWIWPPLGPRLRFLARAAV